MTVELQRRKKTWWNATGHFTMHLNRSLPFFQTKSGAYVHRVRSGNVHFRDNKANHTSISFWCGGTGFIGVKKREGTFFDTPPEIGSPICATCEGRAIGAGQTESRLICGRVVKFSPRK